jgi:hypothetical protein
MTYGKGKGIDLSGIDPRAQFEREFTDEEAAFEVAEYERWLREEAAGPRWRCELEVPKGIGDRVVGPIGFPHGFGTVTRTQAERPTHFVEWDDGWVSWIDPECLWKVILER